MRNRLDDVMKESKAAFDEENEKALLIVREHFVSLYAPQIRMETLERELSKFAKLTAVSTLGIAVFDDNNVVIEAGRVVVGETMRRCRGSYWFDEEDIQPADPTQICEILNAPFLRGAMEKILACEEGDEMAQMFEEETGLDIYSDCDICEDSGMQLQDIWNGADVYCK